ncbi:MAG TPA: ATP-binding protein [Vicinamibacteria bacterium]|nr:ATP-binding protein [Vicinamibacteria bacterium]
MRVHSLMTGGPRFSTLAATACLLWGLANLAVPGAGADGPGLAWAMALGGAALLPQRRDWLSRLLASAVVPVGLLVWLLHGRVSPASALATLLAAAALLAGRQRPSRVADAASLALLALALLSGLGWLFGVPPGSPFASLVRLPLPATAALALLALGLLATRSDRAWLGVMTSPGAGGIVVRRLLPVTLLLPVVVGFLRMEVQRVGLLGTEEGLTLMVFTSVVLSSTLVWWTALPLHRTEQGLQALARQQAALARLGQRALAGVSRRELLDEAVRLVVETLGVEACSVWATPGDGSRVRLAGAGPGSSPPPSARFTIEGRGRSFGVMEVSGQRPPRFNGDDTHFLEAVAHGIGAAVGREEAEAEAERFFTLSIDLLCIVGLDGRMRRVNPGWDRLLGWSAEEILARPFLEFVHPEDRERVTGIFQELAAGRTDTISGESRSLGKDGSVRWLAWVARLDPERGLIYAGIRDVTEQRKLEEQLRQSQKLDAIGRLAGGVAHDFNNLLSVIGGFADLAKHELSPQQRAHGRLMEIERAVDRAAALTRQLLAFSRHQVLLPRRLRLNAVLSDLEKMLNRLIREDIRLVLALEPGLGLVKADVGQIEQVILNLVVNARDAMPQGGTLVLETENVELSQDYARSHLGTTAGPHVLLAVTDTGTGIAPEVLPHIFEPFFTTKEVGKGTGLGLATVYGIVRQSGGHIRVYSEPGRGTTFKVYLPREIDGDEDLVTEGESAAGTAQGGTETILLVEDDDAVRNVAQEILETAGYTVVAAPGPEEALSAFSSAVGPVALVISDVVMPERSGPELVQALRAAGCAARVLLISGYTDDALAARGALAPGVDFLSKPFSAGGLLRKVREVLDRPDPSPA